jgi:hypothetical protein
MSWLSELLHPGNAYKKAGDVSNQFYNQSQNQLTPYNQMGQQAGGDLQSMLQKLMDPKAFQSELMQGYEQSPYAQQMLKQNQSSGLDAASQMGLMGSSGALNNIQQGAGNIMNQDRNQYLQNLLDMYGQGTGIAQGLYGQGASSAGQQSQNAMNQGNTMSALNFGGHQAGSNMLSNLGSGALQMMMNYLTG